MSLYPLICMAFFINITKKQAGFILNLSNLTFIANHIKRGRGIVCQNHHYSMR